MIAVTKKRLIGILYLTGIIYILLLLAFYIFSNQIIFQSKSLDNQYKFKFEKPFEEYYINTADSIFLHGILFKATPPSRGLIFYTHGNAGNLQRWGEYAIDFTKLGYDVFMYDYRGYGKSTGKSDSENLYTDGEIVFNWVVKKLKPTHVVLYGRSLGATVASDLSRYVNAETLILETPFAEFEDVIYWPLKPVVNLLGTDHPQSNMAALSKAATPDIYIFHGTQDWVVPLSSALKLKPLLPQPDNFMVIEGAGHKNIRSFESYHERLKEILK